ncbi:MAG: phosphate ABC transporter permease PstA [Actinomycetales bacterium]|nr:phosphate ABC transporter permease PstA [Actinomycetales bacterium]
MKGKVGLFLIFVPTITVGEYLLARLRADKKAAEDVVVSSLMWTAAFIVFLPVFSILITTIVRGLPGLKANIFTQTMKINSYSDPLVQGGLLHALVGTLYLIVFSIVISVPLGLLTALYITEIRGRGSGFIQFIVQAMSGVPSVIAGLFIFSAVILSTPLKASSIVGSFALSILMVPTITRASQEVLALIPNDLREAGLALGATQWKTVAMVVVPAAKSGLITAMILGVARIAGETAPLLFVLGGTDALNLNPFHDFNTGLPLYIWKGILIGDPVAVQRSWTGILILLVTVLTFFTLARVLGPKREKI